MGGLKGRDAGAGRSLAGEKGGVALCRLPPFLGKGLSGGGGGRGGARGWLVRRKNRVSLEDLGGGVLTRYSLAGKGEAWGLPLFELLIRAASLQHMEGVGWSGGGGRGWWWVGGGAQTGRRDAGGLENTFHLIKDL